MTNAVQRLEDAGLVRRDANPDDGRSVLATITPAGRELVERCTELLNARVFSALALDAAAVDRGFEVLRDVRRAFGDLR